jgi:sec-independent protein translocase protein TatA
MIQKPARRRRLVVVGLDNPIHIVFIVVILLLVFGAKRLPEIGRSLGGGMREFKDSVSGNHSEASQQTLTPAAQQPQAPFAQAPVAQPAPMQAPVAQPAPMQAPVAQPAPVQAPVPPVAAPPTPAQAAAPAPVEPQPQHQA